MLALARYEDRVCECGFHESLTHDRVNHFTFDVGTCPVCAGTAQMVRRLEAGDERERKALGEKPIPETPRASDGRHVRTRLMHPDEVQQRRSDSRRVQQD